MNVSNMKRVVYFIVIVGVAYRMTQCTACPSAKAGNTVTLSCGSMRENASLGLDWQADTPTGFVTVASCTKEGHPCSVPNTNIFTATFSAGAASTLTIKSASTTVPFNMSTSWSCHWKGGWKQTVCDPLPVSDNSARARSRQRLEVIAAFISMSYLLSKM